MRSYCGQYVASPSLGSAGGTVEKIAYGISIPGFIMTSTLWVHLAAKFVSFVLISLARWLTNGSFSSVFCAIPNTYKNIALSTGSLGCKL